MTTIGTATYSPDDNKLRLYPLRRLDTETYNRVKAGGFKWAPKQELFVAPMWTPGREDLLIELCGEIDDEDKSLTERAEERADRFDEYSDKRAADSQRAHDQVRQIADGIPFGQPILVGHHSERHARKDAQRIEDGMRKAVKMWETSKYWIGRAHGAIHHAKYKERPDVRARRIKTIEADQRKRQKQKQHAEDVLKMWEKIAGVNEPERQLELALQLTNAVDHFGLTMPDGSDYWTAWGALKDNKVTVEYVLGRRRETLPDAIAYYDRWLAHYANRLAYERAMLAEDGGTIADQTKPEKGGAVRCWASHRGGWSYIQKVNKVTVTVLDNWGNGGANFTRNIEFDKLKGVMTAAQVQQARDDGRLIEAEDKTGFFLKDTAPETRPTREVEPEPEGIAAMRDTLKGGGVKVVSAPQLFPTPPAIADQMVEYAGIRSWESILEPSAGTGRILDAILRAEPEAKPFAVEINHSLAEALASRFPDPNKPGVCTSVLQGDFLDLFPDQLGLFDKIIMNPPFERGADIEHILHARKFLKPGGRLVALCAAGPRQRDALQAVSTSYETLEPGSFKEEGTGVNVALLVIDAEEAAALPASVAKKQGDLFGAGAL